MKASLLNLLPSFCLPLSLFIGVLAAQPLAAKEPNYNILLFTADDLHAESLATYGSQSDMTPQLDAFAKAGIIFDQAHVNAAICAPSRAVIATGLLSHNSGAMGFMKADPGTPNVVDILQREGYLTGVLGKVGHSTNVPVIGTDFYPTILDMRGLPLLPKQHLDGESMTGLLQQTEGGLKREALYWHKPTYIGPGHPNEARPSSVIRKGKWKLIESLEDGRVELYDLEADIGETTNLAQGNPELVSRLRAMLKEMRREQSVEMPTKNPKASKS